MAAKTYRTIQGDSFDAIAFRRFGDEHLCRKIMDANVDFMDALIFGPGVELVVPDLRVPKRVADLPPWYGKNNGR